MYASSMNERILNAVTSELQSILSQHVDATRDKKLEIVPLEDPKSVPANNPLIVLCINASRLGTDVEQALQQVKCMSIMRGSIRGGGGGPQPPSSGQFKFLEFIK